MRPSALLKHPLLDEWIGRSDLDQARESQPDRIVQGSRRSEPGRAAERRGEAARRHQREHGESRSVRRAGVPSSRGSLSHRRAGWQQSGQERRDTRAWCGSPRARPRLRRCAGVRGGDGPARGLALRAFSQRAASHRWRGDLRSRSLRGVPRRRLHLRADRRRQRCLRLRHRPHCGRLTSQGHRCAGGSRGCVREIVARPRSRGRAGGNVCRRPRDADDLRPDLSSS